MCQIAITLCHTVLLYTIRNGILPMGFISQVATILAFTATLWYT